MHYAEIKNCDIANGTGVRVSLFVSGCTHHCKNCFNAVAWDFEYGQPFTTEVEEKIFSMLAPTHIAGLTLLGGEPFEPVNQRALLPFLRELRRRLPAKNLWCYTGYVYDRDLLPGGRAYCEATDEMLSYLDVLVDGPFIEEEKSLRLRFRGSRNQRLIDMKATRRTGHVVLLEE